MISEAVKVALNEMNKDNYRDAMNNHKGLMDKVGPRTFARRTRGSNAQGKPRTDDIKTMQRGGVNAWNGKYCIDNFDNTSTDRRSMTFVPKAVTGKQDCYGVRDRYFDKYGSDMSSLYLPTDKNHHRNLDFDYVRWNGEDGEEFCNTDDFDEPYDVADQMTFNNGKYIPGKGWQ